LVTAAMVFSPNTQNRNLVLAAFTATLLFVSLCSAARTRERTVLALACLFLFVALLLPIATMGHELSERWASSGAACFGVLLMCLLAVWISLRRLANSPEAITGAARNSPEMRRLSIQKWRIRLAAH
jgi:hypothetical protein